MKTIAQPLPMRLEPELRAMLVDASKRTGLSQTELVRQSIRRALPQIVRVNSKPPGLPAASLKPLTAKEWEGVNRVMHEDAEEIRQMARLSALPSKEDLD